MLNAPVEAGVADLDAAARYLLDRHAGALPDLSGLVVAVANRRAGRDFAHALMRAAGVPALVPPRVVPLKAWALEVADPPEPQMRRLARLAAELRRQRWLGEVDRWTLAGELLALVDELSAARLGADLERRLDGAMLGREAALVDMVWRALNADGSDPQACYAAALERRLDDRLPLYLLAPGPLTALERRFLERYAERAPVVRLEPRPDTPAAATLASAWRTTESPLIERARDLRERFARSPLSELRVAQAADLESGARAVATWVSAQLAAGRSNLALIALDRLTARRARALLERMDVLVADETGWMLSTTSAAALVDRWLVCLTRDFPNGEWQDVPKSPIWGEPDQRQDDVLRLELALRRHRVARGRVAIEALARRVFGAALPDWLATLFAAADGFASARAPLAGWLRRLRTSLSALGADSALQRDPAGARLWALLDQHAQTLDDDGEKYDFNAWRRWLDLALEAAPFVDPTLDSPIVLTSLPAARGRRFDAVALIGFDAERLPARAAPSLFSQSVRKQLGLPGATEAAEQAVADLIPLIADVPALVVWQAWDGGDPRAPSPLLVRLQTLHRAAWGGELGGLTIGCPPAAASALPAATTPPAPAVGAARLPLKLSPTAYQTLLDCPYRFFAERVLGLKLMDEADEALDKSDYGSALHAILKAFHDSDPPVEFDPALARLNELSEAEFARVPAYHAAAWRARWAARQPGYIGWWLREHAAGWRFAGGEQEITRVIEVAGLGAVTLGGRIDRLDARDDTQRVIDYKTSAAAGLRKKNAAPDEAVQLPVYAWLAEAAAAFLAIDGDQVEALALDGETDVEAIALRLRSLLEKIVAGAPLVANGVDAVCAHCDAKGLCRKGMWVDAPWPETTRVSTG